MALLCEKGSFTKTTSTGVPVSQTVNLSNSSLTPKLVILWTTAQTTNDGTYTDNTHMAYGWSDGTNHAVQSFYMNESTETERHVFRNDSVMCLVNLASATIISQATVSAFAAGSFTLSWSVQTDTTALVIHYMVIGGTDITNCQVVNTTTQNTATGNHSWTGTGTAYTPDFALCMRNTNASTTINSVTSGADRSLFTIGATNGTNTWNVSGRDETVATSDCDMYHVSGSLLTSHDTASGAVTYAASFVSFDNAAGGGITLNVTDGAGAATEAISFLFVKGGVWDCGVFQQRSGTGTQDITLPTSFNPELVFLAGIGSATTGTLVSSMYIGLGASDGTNEGASWFGNTDALGTFQTARTNLNTKVFRYGGAPAATGSSTSTVAECDMSDMATAAKFQLNWTTADSTLRRMAYWTVGTTAPAGNAIERALATETITVGGGTIAELAAKIRTRTETAITVGETRTRLAAKNRALATQTTALSESIIRVKGKIKTLATETITVTGGTLARLLAKIRTGSDTTAIVENRARLAAKNRTLSLQSTTITGGTIARLKAAIRIALDTTTISENRQRLGSKSRPLSPPIETVAISESLQKIKAVIKTLATQTVAISESRARIKGAVKTIATQTIILNENAARLSAKIRALATQTVTLTEDLQRTLTAGAQNIVKTISQTVTLGESIARLKASQRTIPLQTIIVGAGTIARLTAKIRTVPQTIVLADNRARLAAKLRAIPAQTIVLTDNRTRIKGAIRTISQTIILSDNRARLAAKTRVLAAQTIVLADSVARQIIGGPVEIIRALTQTVVLSDSLGRRLTAQRLLSQTVPTAETLARVRGVLRTLSQNIPVSESRSRIKSASRTLSQTISTSDNLSRLNALRRTVIQTTAIAENVAAETVGNLVRSLVETITVSDSIVRRTAKLVIITQMVVLPPELIYRVSTKLRAIPAETITLSDSVTNELNVIIKHAIRTLAQAITITEYAKIEVVKKSQRFRKILDPSIKRLKSNHPAWFLGTRGMHDHFEEFSP